MRWYEFREYGREGAAGSFYNPGDGSQVSPARLESCWLFLFRVSHSHLLRREVEDKRPALDLVSLPISPGDKRLKGKKRLLQNFCKTLFHK